MLKHLKYKEGLKVFSMKPEFWWIYTEIIFSLTMQSASYTIIFKEFVVIVDCTSKWFLHESNQKQIH
jgi:hypothetical protein